MLYNTALYNITQGEIPFCSVVCLRTVVLDFFASKKAALRAMPFDFLHRKKQRLHLWKLLGGGCPLENIAHLQLLYEALICSFSHSREKMICPVSPSFHRKLRLTILHHFFIFFLFRRSCRYALGTSAQKKNFSGSFVPGLWKCFAFLKAL